MLDPTLDMEEDSGTTMSISELSEVITSVLDNVGGSGVVATFLATEGSRIMHSVICSKSDTPVDL